MLLFIKEVPQATAPVAPEVKPQIPTPKMETVTEPKPDLKPEPKPEPKPTPAKKAESPPAKGTVHPFFLMLCIVFLSL